MKVTFLSSKTSENMGCFCSKWLQALPFIYVYIYIKRIVKETKIHLQRVSGADYEIHKTEKVKRHQML